MISWDNEVVDHQMCSLWVSLNRELELNCSGNSQLSTIDNRSPYNDPVKFSKGHDFTFIVVTLVPSKLCIQFVTSTEDSSALK